LVFFSPASSTPRSRHSLPTRRSSDLLMKTYNKTAILVTHDLGEAISMSDRIYLMESSPGKIAKTFEVPEELRKEAPFFVRRHPKYQAVFDEIWKHLSDDMSAENERKD